MQFDEDERSEFRVTPRMAIAGIATMLFIPIFAFFVIRALHPHDRFSFSIRNSDQEPHEISIESFSEDMKDRSDYQTISLAPGERKNVELAIFPDSILVLKGKGLSSFIRPVASDDFRVWDLYISEKGRIEKYDE